MSNTGWDGRTAYQVVHDYEAADESEEQGCSTWLNLADELSDPSTGIEDLDREWIARADAWATRMGLPPVGQVVDIDIGIEMAARAILQKQDYPEGRYIP